MAFSYSVEIALLMRTLLNPLGALSFLSASYQHLVFIPLRHLSLTLTCSRFLFSSVSQPTGFSRPGPTVEPMILKL